MKSSLPSKIRIRGEVFSGSGDGAKYTRLPWVKRQMEDKLGFTPYPGTLNLKLSGEHVKLRKLLHEAEGVEILPTEKGYCRGKCLMAYLMDSIACAVVLPAVPGYPEDVLEVLAPVNLRERLDLKDGDSVEITVILR